MIENYGAIPYIQSDAYFLLVGFYVSFGLVPVAAFLVNIRLKAKWKKTECRKRTNQIASHTDGKSKQQDRNQTTDFPTNASADSEINSVSA